MFFIIGAVLREWQIFKKHKKVLRYHDFILNKNYQTLRVKNRKVGQIGYNIIRANIKREKIIIEFLKKEIL